MEVKKLLQIHTDKAILVQITHQHTINQTILCQVFKILVILVLQALALNYPDHRQLAMIEKIASFEYQVFSCNLFKQKSAFFIN
jgi:hypothetical protein